MLRSGDGPGVIGANIKMEMMAGKPRKQAIAIAMRKAGKAKPKKKGKA